MLAVNIIVFQMKPGGSRPQDVTEKILRLTKTFFKHLFIFYGYEHLPICMYSWPPIARGGQKKVPGPLEVTLLVVVSHQVGTSK